MSGVLVWFPLLYCLQLPFNANFFPRQVNGYAEFTLHNQWGLTSSEGLQLINFKDESTRWVKGKLPNPDKLLYWQQKGLLYWLRGYSYPQYLQVINTEPPLQMYRSKPLPLRNLKGWYIDTLRQQLVTIHVNDDHHKLMLNYRDSLGNLQGQDTIRINTPEKLFITKIVRIKGEFLYQGSKTVLEPKFKSQKGIFKLKKIPDTYLYQDTLLCLAPERFDSEYRKKPIFLTSKGIEYSKPPPFLDKNNPLLRMNEDVLEIKNGYSKDIFIYYQSRDNYVSLGKHYLKYTYQWPYLNFKLLDAKGKVIAENRVGGRSGFRPIILDDEIVFFNNIHEHKQEVTYARFDSRTLKRLSPPSFFGDLQYKIHHWLDDPWQENSFYALLLVALVGFPVVCWWGWINYPNTHKKAKKSWYITLIFYVIIALSNLFFMGRFIYSYFPS